MSTGDEGSLQRCVGDVERFLGDAWTRRPHHRERSSDDTFADLLSLDDVDRILSTTSLRRPAFRLVRDGRPLPPRGYVRSGRIGGQTVHDLPDVGRVLRAFEEGATIVLQGLHRYWAPLTRFCSDLEESLTHPVQANAYLTPPGSQGLRVHHDTHDVFALQSHGRKRWVTYEPVIDTPVASQRWSRRLGEPGAPTLDIELGPGDCLYVPRGTLHAAATVDEASLHITIGINAVTWHDVFQRVLARTSEDVSFRDSLPVGFAADPDGLAAALRERLDDLSSWIAGLDPSEVATDEVERLRSRRAPILEGQLPQLLALDRIDDDTVVQRRPHSVCELSFRAGEAGEDGRLTVTLADRRLEMPAHVESAVRLLTEGGPVKVGHLADHLDAEGRRVLARRLVREGLLLAHLD